MPYDSVTRKHYDSGDYPQSLKLAREKFDLDAWRARQKKGEPDGRRIGIGFATYCEQSAHGTSVFSAWGLPIIPGYDQATVRVTPDGGLEVRVGVHSHGQGMETTLAQVAHEITGIDIASIRVVHGDTGLTPYSTGTYASRSIVMAGGAVANACKALLPRFVTIGAHLMQCAVDTARYENGQIIGPQRSIPLREVAQAWYLRPDRLPPDVDLGGLEATVGFKPKVDSGAFSYASHAAAVAVDTELGDVEILDYVIVEDCGTLVNPMVVDGQTLGGVAQGIGTALYEESPYDANGQPLASTFADYLLPGPTEVPAMRIFHMETPSPYTAFGIKGMGEGGAIAPPAVIFNAVNDALQPLGVELAETPLTPRRLLAAIERARAAAARRRRAHEGRAVRLRAAARPQGDAAAPRPAPRRREAHRRRPVARPDAQPAARAPAAAHRRGAARCAAADRGPRHGVADRRRRHAFAHRGCARQASRRRDAAATSPSASPIARCATAAPSAAASRMPIRRRTGRSRSPRSARASICAATAARAACRSSASCSASSPRRSPTTRSSSRSTCRSSPAPARYGYYKFCRKTGEFAEASARCRVRSAGRRRAHLLRRAAQRAAAASQASRAASPKADAPPPRRTP